MAYATKADIIMLYSENALYVADRYGDGVPDDAAISTALDFASSEMDAYIGVRYALPLSDPPSVLTKTAVDIALYALAAAREVQTEEHKERNNAAIDFLKNLAKGHADLQIPGPVDPDTGQSAPSGSPRPIVSTGPERAFTRTKMQGL